MPQAKIHKVKRTGRSRDGVQILEVSLMVSVSDRVSSEVRGWVYDSHVELKTDITQYDLNPDEIKEQMAGIAHQWVNTFGDSNIEL